MDSRQKTTENLVSTYSTTTTFVSLVYGVTFKKTLRLVTISSFRLSHLKTSRSFRRWSTKFERVC